MGNRGGGGGKLNEKVLLGNHRNYSLTRPISVDLFYGRKKKKGCFKRKMSVSVQRSRKDWFGV